MRLIDADALYELLDGGYDLDFDEVPETKRELLRMISEQPTIEERKKGKWIQKSKPLDFCTEWWYECSECGSKPPNDRYGHSNYLSDYCPNCGADMRGEECT